MTQIHPRINIELQYIRYTSEYILKLHIHQHSLLTRKVFSRHSFSGKVFFSVSFGSLSSSRILHLQVISIFKSSLDLDHHWIWIIIGSGSSSLALDHHSIWIISIGSEWSLDLDHHRWIIITRSRSSLDLDHHCWIIITGSRSSLDLDHHYWIIIICAISWLFSW